MESQYKGKLEKIPDSCNVLPTRLAMKSTPNSLRAAAINTSDKPSKKGMRVTSRGSSRR